MCSAVRDAAPATHPLAAAAMTRIEVRAAGGELDDGSAQVRLQAARRGLAGALGGDFETRLAPGALWAAASAAVIAADLGEPDAAEHYETVTAGLERHAVDRALVAAHGLLAQLRGRLPA